MIPSDPPFSIMGPSVPQTPVVLAVPHAGRVYPPELLAQARVGPERLRMLEDRYADRLVEAAVSGGATAVVAGLARAAIDLNRDPREIDPAMIEGSTGDDRFVQSAKVRAGLGLFPRRLPACGELWRGRLPVAEAARRLAWAHEPYHRAIAGRLEMARARFGGAILVDCHSMPALPVKSPGRAIRVVLGDRFGAAATASLVDMAMAVIEGAGLGCARNHPYAGGYTVERHGKPRKQIHALQIEFDRTLYLDAVLDQPAEGLEGCAWLLAQLTTRLGELIDPILPMAAE